MLCVIQKYEHANEAARARRPYSWSGVLDSFNFNNLNSPGSILGRSTEFKLLTFRKADRKIGSCSDVREQRTFWCLAIYGKL